MKVSDLETPCLVVDLDRLESNMKRMAERVLASGARLRPHVKTHKTPEVARMQLASGATGITVAKLGEAEAMAQSGFDDIFIANLLVDRGKLERLAGLARTVRIRLCTDSYEGAQRLSDAAVSVGQRFDVLLDIDTGLRRTGVEPEKAVKLGCKIAGLPGIRLIGVFSYAGNWRGISDEETRRTWAEQEALTTVSVSRQLRERLIDATEVSVAGTSSALFASGIPGVTEVRPGTYVFNDMNYVRQGIQSISSCALKIHATVISRPAADRAVIDAGSKVLTTEKRITADGDPGYGFIERLPDCRIESLWEEHGVLRLDEDGRQLRVGDTIEIIPNHVCPTINLADKWYGMRSGIVEREFSVLARGKVR